MPEELKEVLDKSLWETALTIIKYIIGAGILALPFVWINEKLKKKEKEIIAKKRAKKAVKQVEIEMQKEIIKK